MEIGIFKNVWFKLLPFLLLYISIVLIFHEDTMVGDEQRYIDFANNLINGYYSPPGQIKLWNGPGYPLVLAPFVYFKLPLICIPLLNAFFHYFSIVLLFKTLPHFVSRKMTLVFGLFWAFYYIAYQDMQYIMTESLTIFLVSALLYFTTVAFKTYSKKHLFLSGFFIGYLVLTKVIFGYVLLFLFCGYLIWYLVHRTKKKKWAVLILLTAFLTNLPYLSYTFHLTGKIFYWANSGGMSLYWASTPYENEFGDWNSSTLRAACDLEPGVPCNEHLFRKNHEKDYEYVYQFTGAELDDAFKRLAIKNIRDHPGKYFKNCVANMGRLMFGMPFSYYPQRFKTLLRFPLNSIILVMLMFSGALSLYNLKRIRFEMMFFLSILSSYLFLSVLVSAYPRQFHVIVSIILLWTAYLADNTISIRFRIEEDKTSGTDKLEAL
jgi:4-amino-4-deoxy-L-arabinose transferase-like glycosyltransferase